MARKELAATLTSSAVCRSVVTTGTPVSMTGAKTSSSRPRAHCEATPNTSRSGRKVSSTAKPSRRNSGFRQFDLLPRGRKPVHQGRQPGRRPDGDGRLADDQGPAVQVWGERRHAGVHVGEVGGEAVLALWCADADEVHVSACGCQGRVRGERETSGGQRLLEQLRQAGLEERHAPVVQPADLTGVDVDADDLVADDGHADGMGGAEVPGADHADALGGDGAVTRAEVVRQLRRHPVLMDSP